MRMSEPNNANDPKHGFSKKQIIWATALSVMFLVPLIMMTDRSHIERVIHRVSFGYFFASFLVLFSANIVRSHRFVKLDHTSGQGLFNWWVINQVYNLATATLPGGTGEIATAYILRRFFSLTITAAMRIILLTRVMDLAWLCLLVLFSAVWIGAASHQYGITAIWISSVLFLVASGFLFNITERILFDLVEKILPSGYRITTRVRESVVSLREISQLQRSKGVYKFTIAQSVFVVLGAAISVHLMFVAVGVDFTYVQSFYCFGIYALFQLVPVQGIAGVGTQAAWWAIALKAAGCTDDDTISLGIILHAMFYVSIILMGMIAVLAWFARCVVRRR